ncbi:red chlorophyll catabolite reductase, chloroplastic [Euphorbia lathyris]|uniref:red chlorophyll catabolite reductase, chloroplastic n=1 Tax=Euphorbia lathyris TaxID=212925 RepID=UPI003313FACB
MAISSYNILHSSFFFPSTTPLSPKLSTIKISASSSTSSASSEMDLHSQGRAKFLEFPFVSAPHRDLMVDLVSTVENRLGSQLLPCTLPLDVQHCRNETATAQASLHIRSGHQSSAVDFILGSWLHCKLPTGAALNITSLTGYLNLSTDAPNFIIELIQSNPTSLVFILDLPPRKDLVLYPNYLKTFYENTQLETHRQTIQNLPEVSPYVSPSLYLRSLLSPTSIMVRVETDEGRMEEIIKNEICPVVKEVVGIWLDHCACGGREVEEEEMACLKKRDELVKKKTIEIDLGSNFPRLFGPELTERVLGAIKQVYNV